MMNRIAPEWITDLKPGEIFVFGSNLDGRHGKGAAVIAKGRFGAREGVGYGRTGNCYAIPTKGHGKHLPILPLETIGNFVRVFIDYAAAHPELRFLVTRIGCGLALYNEEQVAPLFGKSPAEVPANICLPLDFWRVINK